MLKRCQGGRNMYQIGKFAKMNNVSLHTLRWYDNIGILKAHKKDKFSKFRFYTDEDVRILNNVRILQSFNFTIEEISKLNKGLVKNKIKEIKDKTTYYEKYMFLLQNLILEENMKEINLKEKFENLPPMLVGGIRGEWKSEGSSENFREVANYPNCEKLNGDKFKKLFFGEENFITYVTDGKNFGKLNKINNSFTLNEKTFKYATTNLNLIIWENDNEEYTIYRRKNDKNYTKQELEKIIEKTKLKENFTLSPLNEQTKNILLGEWNFEGLTLESKIDAYPENKLDESKHVGPWAPHYMYLKFNENGSVQTMKDGEILEIVNRQLTPENTMSIYCNDAIIDDSFSKKYRLPFKIRKIKNSYYLFLQADSLKMPTLDEICYVYKKS